MDSRYMHIMEESPRCNTEQEKGAQKSTSWIIPYLSSSNAANLSLWWYRSDSGCLWLGYQLWVGTKSLLVLPENVCLDLGSGKINLYLCKYPPSCKLELCTFLYVNMYATCCNIKNCKNMLYLKNFCLKIQWCAPVSDSYKEHSSRSPFL